MSHRDPEQRALALMGLDLLRRRVHTGDETRRLSARDVEVLRYLLDRVDKVVPREELEREVWGMAPTVRSEAVGIALRRLRSKIEPDPSAPRFLHNVHGVGWQLLLGESYDADAHTNLATPLDGFESSAVWVELSTRSERWMTLVGPPGIGKTRIARRYGRMMIESDALDEAWEVALTEPVDALGLRQAIGAALGVPGPAVAATLAARGLVLLLLDGADLLDREALADVEQMCMDLPRLRILATAPRPVQATPEVYLEVTPLDREAAMRLLRVRLAEAGRADADEADLARLAEAVEGVPLALELCATRARIVPLDRLNVPAANEVALDALRWSWGALEPELRTALAQCAVFKAPFALDAAEAIVSVTGHDTLDLLVRLAEHGLLGVDPRGPSFTMRQRLRQAVALEVDAETVERHRTHFFGWMLARHAERVGPLGWRAVAAVLEAEADVLAALDGSVEGDRAELALAVGEYLGVSGSPERRLAALEQPTGLLEEPLRSRLLAAQSHVLTILGRIDDARDLLARADGDNPYVLRARGYVHSAVVDEEAARAAAERALEVGVEDPMLRVAIYVDLGLVETRAGNTGEAEACYRRAFALLRSLGNRTKVPRVRNMLAQHYCFLGAFDDALELLNDGVDPEEAGRGSAGLTACLRGVALGALGQLEEGVAAMRDGIAISMRVGEADRASFGLMTMADLLIELERIDEAEQAGIEALQLATDALHICGALTVQASVARWSGAWRVAARALTQMLEITEAGPITCHAHATLATVRAAQGELEEAERHTALATAALTTTGDPVADAKVAIAEAAVAAARGDRSVADQLLKREWDSAELRVERELLTRHLGFVSSSA